MALRLLQDYSSASEAESDVSDGSDGSDDQNEESIKVTKLERQSLAKLARNINILQRKLSGDVNANKNATPTTSKQQSPAENASEENANSVDVNDMVTKNNFINSNMHRANSAEQLIATSFDESHFDKCINEINRINKANSPRQQLIKTDDNESGQENSPLESDSNSDSDWESFSNSDDEVVWYLKKYSIQNIFLNH